MYQANYAQAQSVNAFFSKEHECIKNIRTTKLNVMYHVVDNSLMEQFYHCMCTIRKKLKWNASYEMLNSLLSMLTMIVIIWLSLRKMMVGEITLGEFIIFFNYHTILSSYLNQLLNFGSERQAYLLAKDRLDEVLNYAKDKGGEQKVESVDTLQVKKVSKAFQG